MFINPGFTVSYRVRAEFDPNDLLDTEESDLCDTSDVLNAATATGPCGGYTDVETESPVNNPPVGMSTAFGNDTRQTILGTAINEALPGVLANDTDVDSPLRTGDPPTIPGFIGRRAVLLTSTGTPIEIAQNAKGLYTTTTTGGGVVILNRNGSFTYTPKNPGPDSFRYKADDGFWTDHEKHPSIALSDFGGVKTVNITVFPKGKK